MMRDLTFEKLPEAISQLWDKLETIEYLLKEKGVSNNSIETEQLLNVEEAAKFLTVSIPTIYQKSKNGEIPSMKQGKRLYFSNIELLAYVKEGRKKTNKEIEIEVDNFLAKKGGKNA